jgi:Tol biopolymer transport system component
MKKLLLIFGVVMAANVAFAAKRPGTKKVHFSPLQLINKIVFTRGRPAVDIMIPGNEVVWTMNSDGSGQKAVWRVPKGYGRFGGFNNKGTQALSYNRFNVYLHDLNSHHIQHLFVHSSGWGTYVDSVSFSRDGKRVLFAAGGGGNALSSNVYIIVLPQSKQDIDQKEYTPIPSPPNANGELLSDMFEPRYSPDGKRLVVSIGYRTEGETLTGSWNIWSLNIDGSSPVQLTANPPALVSLNAFDKTPCFSPDGQKVAFVRCAFLIGIGETNDVWLVDAQHQKRLTSYEEIAKHSGKKPTGASSYNSISNLCFSPDGKRIAFNQIGRESGIYCVGIDGNKLKRLTNGTLVQWVW